MKRLLRLLGAAGLLLCGGVAAVRAQAGEISATGFAARGRVYGQPGSDLLVPPATLSQKDLTSEAAPYGPPVMDNMIFGHVLFDQMEGRTNGPDNEFRWDGEGWIGTDMDRLWFKSEGFVERGLATDGDQEALYDRPITTYFDAQAGVRYDLDSNPGRVWGAIGIEGLAPYFFQFAPTFYFSDNGYVAGRITGSYDLLITNRLFCSRRSRSTSIARANTRAGLARVCQTSIPVCGCVTKSLASSHRTSASLTREHTGRPPHSHAKRAGALTILVSSSEPVSGTDARGSACGTVIVGITVTSWTEP